jgi:hypothetical protein
MDKLPCRVSVELSQHLRLQEQAEERRFDPWDAPMMQDLFGERLAGPLSTLLIALEQVEKTQASFGADADKAIAFLVPKIAALRDACIEEFDYDPM